MRRDDAQILGSASPSCPLHQSASLHVRLRAGTVVVPLPLRPSKSVPPFGGSPTETVRVTDYWGEPTETPERRRHLTDRLDPPR